MLDLPEITEIRAYHVYNYHFLDDLGFVRRPRAVFSSRKKGGLAAVIHAVRQRFLDAGWEGDGEIGIIWLPPFVGIGLEDTWGTYIWHVKQSNNGTSFLASALALPFGALRDSTTGFWTRSTSLNIIETHAIQLGKDLMQAKMELKEGLQHLWCVTADAARERLASSVLAHSQAILIRTFFDFMDNCYLRFLIEGIAHGNRRLKLAPAKVHLDPPRYLPEDGTDEITSEGSQWLTLHGITSDIWRAFKWEPYKEKMRRLCAAVQFSSDPVNSFEITKHVTLRNCIQHRDGRLDADSLRQCGVSKVNMRGDDGAEYSLEAGAPICLSCVEVCDLADRLGQFGREFNEHVGRTLPTREYLIEAEVP